MWAISISIPQKHSLPKASYNLQCSVFCIGRIFITQSSCSEWGWGMYFNRRWRSSHLLYLQALTSGNQKLVSFLSAALPGPHVPKNSFAKPGKRTWKSSAGFPSTMCNVFKIMLCFCSSTPYLFHFFPPYFSLSSLSLSLPFFPSHFLACVLSSQ